MRTLIEGTPGIRIPLPSPTNMLYLEVADGPAYAQRLAAQGVRVLATSPGRVRLVFHLDIAEEDVEITAAACKKAAQT